MFWEGDALSYFEEPSSLGPSKAFCFCFANPENQEATQTNLINSYFMDTFILIQLWLSLFMVTTIYELLKNFQRSAECLLSEIFCFSKLHSIFAV